MTWALHFTYPLPFFFNAPNLLPICDVDFFFTTRERDQVDSRRIDEGIDAARTAYYKWVAQLAELASIIRSPQPGHDFILILLTYDFVEEYHSPAGRFLLGSNRFERGYKVATRFGVYEKLACGRLAK